MPYAPLRRRRRPLREYRQAPPRPRSRSRPRHRRPPQQRPPLSEAMQPFYTTLGTKGRRPDGCHTPLCAAGAGPYGNTGKRRPGPGPDPDRVTGAHHSSGPPLSEAMQPFYTTLGTEGQRPDGCHTPLCAAGAGPYGNTGKHCPAVPPAHQYTSTLVHYFKEVFP